MRSFLSKNTFILVLLLALPEFCLAEYNTHYDPELARLTIESPHDAINRAQKQLLDTELSKDVDKQLIALFYLAEAYSVLTNSEQVDYYVEKGLLLAREHNNITFISEFLAYQAYQADHKGQFREANKLVNQALILSQETDDERLIATMYALRGQIQLSLENYQQAIDDVELSLKTFKENNDRERISIYYNLLALVYSALDDVDNSIKFLKESILYDDVKSPYNMSVFHYNIGASYMQKGDYDLAREHMQEAMSLAKKMSDESTIAFINYGLAEMSIMEEKWDDAERYLIKSIKYFETSKDLMMHFNNNLVMVDVLANNKRYDEATLYLDYAETQLQTLDTSYNKLAYINAKINLLSKQEMWEEAFGLTKDRDKIRREINDKEKEISLNEMKIRFDAQFDRDKLQFLQKENELQQQSILQEQSKRRYLWALVFLAALVFGITYIAYRHQKKIKGNLYRLTQTDDLTGIPNRRHIIEKLTHFHATQSQDYAPLGIVMIDLDHFKKVNDTYGHAKGNDVLIHFAQCAQNAVNEKGFVGRLGGEEWLFILPNFEMNQIQELLQSLRQEYNQPLKLHLPREHKLSFSSGVLICRGECQGVDHMLKNVDDSLYQAKDNGRNQDIYVLK